MEDIEDPLRWVRRAGIGAALVFGWMFIVWQNRFHLTAPVVFVCLAYLAVVATIVNLWRTGASAVAATEAGDDWARPLGAREELEKEKRTLLKAIKEAEFDRDMGKLSAHDADEMIRTYRARAIEVIKAIEGHDQGAASVREQIAKEVKARLELEKERGAGKKKKGKGKAKPEAAKAEPAKAEPAKAEPAKAEPVKEKPADAEKPGPEPAKAESEEVAS